ncbi:hypothetical protein M1328_01955 [Patescibacteria group bacterium]|nr:hypothetical protein [Patescibacteria group bacterium]
MMVFFKPAFDFLKKAFLIIAVYIAVVSLFSFFIHKDKISLQATKNPIEQNRAEIYKVIDDKQLNSTKQGKLMVTVYRMTTCAMLGEACTNNPLDGDKNYDKSFFGFLSNIVVVPYKYPPASGIAWVNDGLQQAGFIPHAFAAEGIGFSAIKPFASIWTIFRDMTYMVLVLVLITIGFMVMFRMKINAQTVISVENALPKIVISLILITFSFAIAGFLIDIMYVVIGIIISILSSNNTNFNATQFKNQFMMASGTDLLARDIPVRTPLLSIGYTLGNSFLGLMPAEISALLRSIIGIVTLFILNGPIFNIFINPIVSAIGLENFVGDILGIGGGPGKVISGLLTLPFSIPVYGAIFLLAFYYLFPIGVYILIIFSILFMYFRIIMLLFTSYLNLIISIILSPLFMVVEAIPGRSTFKNWLIGIIGNLLAFPITIAIFVLAYIIVYNHPDLEFSARFPYLYGVDNGSFKILIGMGLIFIIPDLVKYFRDAIGYKPLPINIGIGTYFGGVSTAVGGGTGILGQFGSVWLGITALGGFKNLLLTGSLKDKAAQGTTPIQRDNVPSSNDATANAPKAK